MDLAIKDILADPEDAICARWGHVAQCPVQSQIYAEVEKLKALKLPLKQQKEAKQLCSRQFKDARGDADRLAALKAQMQAISAALNQLEEQRKQAEVSLLHLFLPPQQNTGPTFPAQCLPVVERPVAGTVNIETVDGDDESWENYVQRQPGASFYHSLKFRDFIQQAVDHSTLYLKAVDEQQAVVGVLPIVGINSKLFGNYAVSLPFVNYGGPLANNASVIDKLFTEAEIHLQERRWDHVEIRTLRADLDLPMQSRKVSMILALPSSDDELEKQLGTKVRAQYKLTEPYHPDIMIGGIEWLDEFYAVFAHNMRDLGTPVYAKDFFRRFYQSLAPDVYIVVVRINNKPVAGAILCGKGEMLEIPWASTLRRVNSLNVNMWMYRQMLAFAIAKGFRFFDFGRSTTDSGTYRFKKQWGAEPVPHYWYYVLAEGKSVPELNPDNPKYKLLIGIWQRLPVWLTKIIGPPVVRNLP